LEVTNIIENIEDTNKSGKIIWKEWKETAFHSLYSITNQGGGETWYNQYDDAETKTILEFTGNRI